MRLACGVLVGLAAVLAAPGPALAACRDDLVLVKVEANRVHDTRKKNLLRQHLSAADTALKRRNESGCNRAVAEVKKILKQRP
ncbi:MAG: hypothetical protein ACT4N4_05860 [Rhodospirillales bacterium]